MDRELLREKLPSMLRKIAKNEAEEGEYDPAEHVDWMAADEIERLRAEKYVVVSGDSLRADNEALSAENERLRAENERLLDVAVAVDEYKKMFARSRTKPYGISNELQALFDAFDKLREVE